MAITMKSNNYKIAVLVALLALGLAAFATIMLVKTDAPAAPVGTVLITGSNRGIGLEFARQYAAKGWTVIATHRQDTVPESLKSLTDQYASVRAERMDVLRHDEIDALASKLRDTPIDVLINNAGIMGTGDPASAQTFGTLNHDLFDRYMRTNALGPIKVAEAFLPHVAASNLKKIVNISSSSGMVSRPPPHSKNMWYRASKTALNGLMVSMVPAARESGVSVTMFEPGWTWTGKNEKNRHAEQREPAEVVALMIETIAGLTLDDTGRFLTNNGETQPW
jgi:NAD(P)-dependent dehydrogenase (short-subunit alcohol dehydrogenase family)